jgi:hypothetical protein
VQAALKHRNPESDADVSFSEGVSAICAAIGKSCGQGRRYRQTSSTFVCELDDVFNG